MDTLICHTGVSETAKRDMTLTDKVQEHVKHLVANQPLVAEEPLVLEEPVEHDVLSVAAEIRDKRTRHPPTRASKRKKPLISLINYCRQMVRIK